MCIHGVPASCFLYRKVLDELADARPARSRVRPAGARAGRAAEDFDYTWTGLGRFARAAVDALGLDRFDLVVHDIGGPVGFELAAAVPERIHSLTVLNTSSRSTGSSGPGRWSRSPGAASARSTWRR